MKTPFKLIVDCQVGGICIDILSLGLLYTTISYRLQIFVLEFLWTAIRSLAWEKVNCPYEWHVIYFRMPYYHKIMIYLWFFCICYNIRKTNFKCRWNISMSTCAQRKRERYLATLLEARTHIRCFPSRAYNVFSLHGSQTDDMMKINKQIYRIVLQLIIRMCLHQPVLMKYDQFWIDLIDLEKKLSIKSYSRRNWKLYTKINTAHCCCLCVLWSHISINFTVAWQSYAFVYHLYANLHSIDWVGSACICCCRLTVRINLYSNLECSMVCS